jgi:hypothetical protein
MESSERPRTAGINLLAVLVALLTAVGVLTAFVPFVECPGGAYLDGNVEYEGQILRRPHVELYEKDGETNFRTPCPRCKGTSRITLLSKWFGKDPSPSTFLK